MQSLYRIARDVLYGEAGGGAALLTWPLRLASLVYVLVVRLRNLLFELGILKQTRVPAKIVSVGNLTVGGTGKTPWIVFLARTLRERGLAVAVVSRGYKSAREGAVTVVADGERVLLPPGEAGDEPTLIARRCLGVPVILGARRVDAAFLAVERFGARVVLLDDGFQHRRLARDVDLVNFHAGVGVGSGWCLPAGVLREPLGSLARADAMVVHGEGDRAEPLAESLRRAFPGKPLVRSRLVARRLVGLRTGERMPPSALAGKRVLAFAGIAVPEGLFGEVRRLGPASIATRSYPDHFRYGSTEIERLAALARSQGADYTVTSEKDAVKIDPRWIADPGELFFVEADLEIEGGEAFVAWLLERLGA